MDNSEILEEKYSEEIENIVIDNKNKSMLNKLITGYYLKNLSFYKLKELFYRIEEIYFSLKELKEKIEIEKFAVEELDIEAIKEDFRDKRKKDLDKVFPNLNLQRLKELYDKPITSLKSPAYKQHSMVYDSVVSRKYVIAIMQMILNNMDLVVTYCGIEGTGKTTGSTQDAYLCYYILKEIGMIEYKYSLKSVMYYSLKNIIQAFGRYSREKFRIFILDEGNELNRKNWSHPNVQTFIQKLRRERKHLRIVFINLPQLGELTTDLTLARINFIFQLITKSNVKTKLLDKGDCSFYIIPRSERIYSYENKYEMDNGFIRDVIGRVLDDKKKYYKPLPQMICVKKFKKNGIWSFNEDEYDKLSKEANDQFNTIGVSLTKNEIFYLGKFFNLKKLGVKPNTQAYHCLAHLKNKKLKVALDNKEEFLGISDEDDFSED